MILCNDCRSPGHKTPLTNAQKNCLEIAHINARSLLANLLEVKLLVIQKKKHRCSLRKCNVATTVYPLQSVSHLWLPCVAK